MIAIEKPALAAGDELTVVSSIGLRLTKVWDSATGKPRGYERVRQIAFREVPVGNIFELSTLLLDLQDETTSCIIRGKFVGWEAAAEITPRLLERDRKAKKNCEPPKAGYTLRRLELFPDRKLHYFMLDIDGFHPKGVDPVKNPEAAIEQYIARHLPDCFQGVSYHWQLSSSAGHPDAIGTLKAHIWFWLKTPYTGDELILWVASNKIEIDDCVFESVQPNYTAAPVFINGVKNPVPVRSGLCQGWLDDVVDLVITEDMLVAARRVRKARQDIADPSEKEGLIGLFHRTFEIEDVIDNWLPEVFEFVTDTRLNFLQSSSGAREGATITDNRQGIFNSHDSDPFDNRAANKWDLVRVYKFGHLDKDLTPAEKALLSIHELPSHRAMSAFVEALPEIKDAQREVATDTLALREALAGRIRAAASELDLREDVLADVQSSDLPDLDREVLVGEVQKKWLALTGTKLGIKDARRLVQRERPAPGTVVEAAAAPAWIRPWVFCTDKDRFFNMDSGESVSITGFNMVHDRFMGRYVDENGNTPAASTFAKDVWNIETVAGIGYMPGAGRVFEMLGVKWANSYSDREVPSLPPILTDEEQLAVGLVLNHLLRLFPNQRERDLFISWLAHNVRYPGKKIRWAPFIYGAQGVGKSFFLNLLGMCMGGDNVAPLDATTVCSSDFTAWAVGVAVRCLEEVKLHNHNAHDVMNKLKQFITNAIIDVHAKGRDPYRAINVTNYMALSNYIDGLALEKGDRRYFVLHSAMSGEEAVELAEAGYFVALFGAIEQFAGAMRKWLMEVPLHPEFMADGQAPMTDAKKVTIELAKSDISIAAEELIENGGEGISKNVISSRCFTAALHNLTGKDVYTKTVHSVLQNMGFSYYGQIKWKSGAHRVWTRQVPSGIDNSSIRDLLETACFDEGFLK